MIFFLKLIGLVWIAVCVFETKPNRNTYINTYITFVLCLLCAYHLSFIVFFSVMHMKLIQRIPFSFLEYFFKMFYMFGSGDFLMNNQTKPRTPLLLSLKIKDCSNLK